MRWSVRFLVLAPVVLVLAGCSAVPGATSAPPSPSPLAIATREPSPEPSAALSAPPSMPPVSTPKFVPNAVDAVPIPSDTYARVVTNDLRVRSEPGVADDSIKLEPLLQDGTLLVVVDGPVQASGYDWYQVQPTRDFQQEEYPFGWVAAADKDGEPWIQSGNLECPPLPHDIATLAELSSSGRTYYEITCFGGREVTFQARIAKPEAWCGVSPIVDLGARVVQCLRATVVPALPGRSAQRARLPAGVVAGRRHRHGRRSLGPARDVADRRGDGDVRSSLGEDLHQPAATTRRPRWPSPIRPRRSSTAGSSSS